MKRDLLLLTLFLLFSGLSGSLMAQTGTTGPKAPQGEEVYGPEASNAQLAQMIDEESFFWEDDSQDLKANESEISPMIEQKAANYILDFEDAAENKAEWVKPEELEVPNPNGTN